MDQIREDLRRAFDRAPKLAPAPQFTARLRDTLRREAAAMARQVRRRDFFRSLAAAAVFVFACTGLLWTYQAVLGDALLAAAVGDHRYCTLPKDGPLTLDAAMLQWPAYRRLDILPDTITAPAHTDIRVVDRHFCVYGGRQFAHLVLLYHDKRVSLVISRTVEAAHARPGTADVDGLSVVTFRSGSLTVFVVGELSLTDLQTIATLIDQHLRQS